MSANVQAPSGKPVPSPARKWGKRLAIGLIVLLILALLGAAGVSGYVGWNLTHPKRLAVTGSPGDLGLTYQNVNFPSRSDKLQLSGWYIPAPAAQGIVIEAHGYGKNRDGEKPSLPVAKALNQKGLSVLMFDFRDSGSSQGSMVSVGDFEQRDLLGAVDYAKELGYRNIGIIGYSMGASTAAAMAAQAPEVEAVILDSPFADLKSYLEVNMPVWTKLPNFPFTTLILREIPLMTGIDPAHVSPVKALPALSPKPLLLIAGTADDTIPMSNSEELYQKSHDPKAELWLVPGAKHVGAYTVEPDRYLAKVSGFFAANLR